MDYVVLARKLRPQRFQDLVGQDVVARALRNAVQTGRLAHAFLFAGSRGVGKTSTARILAKAINCRTPREGEPCNTCDICQEISAGTSPDVLEIDAASNRGIDNIRELRENAAYTPAKCAFKTYIIDEVHMLTAESFNALLKTLEEPPPHVKFVLATTHPQRVPDTILSRCQRYDFPRIPLTRMVDYLASATAGEGLALSRPVLEAIARNSAGGMRDALTAVDQVVSYAGSAPSDQEALNLLGLLDTRQVLALLEAVLDRALPAALERLGGILARGQDVQSVLEVVLREVKDLALFQTLGAHSPYFQDHLPDTLAFYSRRTVGLDELQQLFHVLLEVEGQLRLSASPVACLEMGLVKACLVQPLVGIPELLSQARALLQGAAPPQAATHAAPASPAVRPVASSAAPVAGKVAAPGTSAAAGGRRLAQIADAMTAQQAGPKSGPQTGRPRERSGGAAPAAPSDTAERPEEPEPPAAESAALRRTAPSAGAAPEPVRAAPLAPSAPSAQPLAQDFSTAGDPAKDPIAAAPCDDPRWQGLAAGRSFLAGRLRTTDVRAIGGDQVQVVVPAPGLTPDELAQLQPAVRDAFGPGVRLVLASAPEGPRARFTWAGRKAWREGVEREARRQRAADDPAVKQLLKLFPQARVADVELATELSGAPSGAPSAARPAADQSADGER